MAKLLRRGEGPPARPKPIPNVWPKLFRRGEGPQRLRWVENALDLRTVWLRPAAAGPEAPRSARQAGRGRIATGCGRTTNELRRTATGRGATANGLRKTANELRKTE